MLLASTALAAVLAAGSFQEPVAALATPVTSVTQDPDLPRYAPNGDRIYDLDDVIVSVSRPRGGVDTDIPPDIVLTAEDIQAYGASDIEELLTLIEPLTRSSRGRSDGRPVMLINGRRTSGFEEVRGIPSEAIERVDILPEDVALQFGYSADQRVVNFVLKTQFRSVTAEATARLPQQGGRTTAGIESDILRIDGANRWSLDAEYESSSPLFESERGLVDPSALPSDPIPVRTLLSDSETTSLRGTLKRDLNSTTQGTFTLSLEDNATRSFNGLPGLVLTRDSDRLNGTASAVLDGFLGDSWRWTLTGNYERSETDTVTQRGSGTTRLPDDTANSVSQTLSSELVLNGDVFELPAGGISSTFRFGADTRSLDSTSLRSGVISERSQSRDRLNGQASFNIPIARRDQEVLPGLGDLSLNVNGGYEDLSDFGGLMTLGANLNWSPIEVLSLSFGYTNEEGAPSISQLNDPVIVTPSSPVFDFTTGQTVLVSRTDGGNPNLSSDSRQVLRVGATLRPLSARDLSFSTTWTRSETEDYIASFPAITEDLEAALPERFTRVGGVLTAVDARPLNFTSYTRQDIRTGFNWSTAFGEPDPAAVERQRRQGGGQFGIPGGPPGGGPGGGMRPPGEGGGPGGFRGGGGGGPRMGGGGPGGGGGRGAQVQPGQGRFNLSIYHTWRLQDEIVIRDGLPVLDLLNGSAISARGGQPEHEIQAQAGVFRNGMGGFMQATWRDSTQVIGTTGPDLDFSDQLTVNLNLFMDLGQRQQWVERWSWLKGSRISLRVDNLFDSRTEVTSSDGVTPFNYLPDYLDPEGRTFRIQFRKILF